jgi:hypothetical protein
MAIVPLPLFQNLQARALLHHLLENGDVVGRDTTGRTIIQLAVDDRVLETLMTFDAEAADLEPEPDDEEDSPPVLLDLVRPRMVERRQRCGITLRLSPGRLDRSTRPHPSVARGRPQVAAGGASRIMGVLPLRGL